MKWPFGRSAARDADLDDEIRAHFAMAIAERIKRGESPEEATAAARREFGNVAHVKEVTRETWGGAWLERLAQDARFTFRSLRRSPGFTAVAVLTFALAIGVNTTMFTVVNGILFRPLAVRGESELFVVSHAPGGPFVNGPAMFDATYAVVRPVAALVPKHHELRHASGDDDRRRRPDASQRLRIVAGILPRARRIAGARP